MPTPNAPIASGLHPRCPCCRDSGGHPTPFSKSPCDTCGSPLAGARYPAHTLTLDGDLHHLLICVDCLVQYAA